LIESVAASDLSIWLAAPKERTAAYFPTYSLIARRIQATLREWTRERFLANPAVLNRPHAARPIIVYIATHPFGGKRTNTFTYDVQSGMLDAALRSAAFTLAAELKALTTEHLEWSLREIYFPYRSDTIIEYVRQRSHALVRMLNAETAIIDDLVKFAIVDVPGLGLDRALKRLRKNLQAELKRFSPEFDLSSRAEELLRIATAELTHMMSR
jgi:hypothetical protein